MASSEKLKDTIKQAGAVLEDDEKFQEQLGAVQTELDNIRKREVLEQALKAVDEEKYDDVEELIAGLQTGAPDDDDLPF